MGMGFVILGIGSLTDTGINGGSHFANDFSWINYRTDRATEGIGEWDTGMSGELIIKKFALCYSLGH